MSNPLNSHSNSRLDNFTAKFERLIVWLAGLGAFIIFIQTLWISYGVFVRYGLGKPDRLVTEATALLLFPVAFCGLAYALYKDAYPKVTMFTDGRSAGFRKFIQIINYLIMLGVGIFFSYAGVSATIRSFNSGAASEILHWPRYIFWAPGAFSLIIFTIYVVLKLLQLFSTSSKEQ